MRHQRTHENFATNLYKSMNPEFSNLYIKNMKENNRKSFYNNVSSYAKNIDFICKEHNRNFFKYCLICKEDICQECYNNNHFIHDTVEYKDLFLNENQMNLFIKEYNEYIKFYSNLLMKIKEWQNALNKAVLEFEEYLKNNIIDVISKMINNYNINEINYNTIIEYRLIYSLLLENKEEKLNNQKMLKIMKSYISLRNYGKYKYIDVNENLSSISKENINILNNSLNDGNFVLKGNNIIKFLFNNFELFSNIITDENNDVMNNFHKLGNYYIKSKDYLKNKDKGKINKSTYLQSGTKEYLNRSTNNIFDSTTSSNFKKLLFGSSNNNKYNIYEKKKPFDKTKNGEIFLEKEELPKFSHNAPIQSDENITENLNINLITKNKNRIQKKIDSSNFPKIDENHRFFTSREQNPLWKSADHFYPTNNKILNDNEECDELDDLNTDLDYKAEKVGKRSINKRPIIFNNNINNFNNINNINSRNNYINTLNINKICSDRNEKSKVYEHRKFNSTLIGFKSVNLTYKNQTDKNQENNFFNTLDLNNYDTYSTNNNNTITISDEKTIHSYREKIHQSTKNIFDKETNKNNLNWKIKKVSEFTIDINKELNIGFELGNSECKIGIINQLTNSVELWVPYESEKNTEDNNKLGIQILISFKDKNDNIIIGNKAEELKINNPSYSFFNFIKYIGKNSNEIKEKRELWPYKIYNNEKIGEKAGRPYVKGNYNGNRNKIYNFEDLLSLYLRKIFELLFNKIKIKTEKNNKNNLLNINIVVTVPNSFNYFQRKVIEKIFQTQLFQKDKKSNIISNYYSENNKNKNEVFEFGKYKIKINNIKIENSSNVGYLYLFQKQIENNFNKLNKNIILLNIEGGSTNISLISTLTKNESNGNNKYEIKGITGTTYGEEDFTDNFIYSCLSDFTEKIKDECINNSGALAKLRKSCEIDKKYFYKKNQSEINIHNLYDNISLKMTLNKADYERACNTQYQQIIELIKDLLKNSKINEKEIDDIIIIGNTTNVNIIKEKISKIFKGKNNELFNKLANDKYFENDKNSKDIINEEYIVIGAALQCFNLYSNSLKFKYMDITPISFGIEGLNKKMDFVIVKGSPIPNKVNKIVKIPKINKGTCISINVYEGENEFVSKNRLISSAEINIKNFKNEKNEKNYIEILIQFIINNKFDLSVFILDSKTLKRKFECVINIDIVKR